MKTVLFDFHTVAANPCTGKFNNLTRFAECLSLDSGYDVRVVYDRPDGVEHSDIRVQHEYLRLKPRREIMSRMETRRRWTSHRNLYDPEVRLWTEIVPHYWPAHPDGNPTVLHVDSQAHDLPRLIRTVRRHQSANSRFHVLTPVQKSQLVGFGIKPDRIHVIPNTFDAQEFEPRLKDPELPYIVYVHGADSDIRLLRRLVPDGIGLIVIGAFDDGLLAFGRTRQYRTRVLPVLYKKLVKNAEMAICLTPSGDSTTTRLIEFAAMGVPFIAPASPGMSSILPAGTYNLSLESSEFVIENRDWLSRALQVQAHRLSYQNALPKLKAMFE